MKPHIIGQPSLSETEALRIENARLRTEIARRKPALPRRQKVIDDAFADALHVIDARWTGLNPGRDNYRGLGLTERRWRRSYQVLVRAGVRKDGYKDLIVDDYEAARRSVELLRAMCEATNNYDWLL